MTSVLRSRNRQNSVMAVSRRQSVKCVTGEISLLPQASSETPIACTAGDLKADS